MIYVILQEMLRELPRQTGAEKITAVAAPFYTIEVPKEPDQPAEASTNGILINQWILIGALAGVLLLLVIIILIIRRRRRKRALAEELEDSQEDMPILPQMDDTEEKEIEVLAPEEDKVAELRESVREFAEQNPEISAQLLKTWLNGGNNNDD